jgi:hypothetical protein
MTAGHHGCRFGGGAQVRSPFKPAHSQRQREKVGPARPKVRQTWDAVSAWAKGTSAPRSFPMICSGA